MLKRPCATVDPVDLILKLVRGILHPRVVEDLNADMRLREDLRFSTIDLLDLALRLEDLFDVMIGDELIQRATISELGASIVSQQKERS